MTLWPGPNSVTVGGHIFTGKCSCGMDNIISAYTAVLSEAWAKLRDWASVAGRGRLLLSGSVAHASLETAVLPVQLFFAF